MVYKPGALMLMGGRLILMRNQIFIIALLVFTFTNKGLSQQSPGLGVEATAEEIAVLDISIAPDGVGLPDGSGTVSEGAEVYAEQCIACHGDEGQGQLNDRLVGGHGSLIDDAPVKTVGSYWPFATTLFDYIRRAMPYLQPQSLTNNEIYALTAYILYLNEVIEEEDIVNAQTLPDIQMSNRDNFIMAYP